MIPVPPCKPDSETVVAYYPAAADFFRKHFGDAPSRTTLYKYLCNGYPVVRGGPYVEVPFFDRLKRPHTTRQALERMLTRIRQQERRMAKLKTGRPPRSSSAPAQARRKR